MTDERLLQPELAATLAASRQRATPERIALVERAIEALRNSDILSPALRAGDLAPALVLTDAQERPVDVAALWGQAPVIFSFYRGGWCPYCSLELRAWQRLLPEVQSCGATLVAVSPQSPSHSLATIDDNTLAFPVLSDSSIAAAEGFGIAFAMADEQIALYERLGIEIAQRNGNGRWVLPLPPPTSSSAADASPGRTSRSTTARAPSRPTCWRRCAGCSAERLAAIAWSSPPGFACYRLTVYDIG